MGAIITLLLVIALSMLVTKVATIALMHTGMSREVARFQARSALTGAGFTTSASEKVVNHPVRRRIISVLMLLGSAGLVTAISSLLLGFVDPASSLAGLTNLIVLFVGVCLLLLATRSTAIDRGLSKAIDWFLRRFTDIDVNEFSKLIGVSEDYEISEIRCRDNPWLAGRTLGETRLGDEGVLVLGIWREPDTYLGTPRSSYEILDTDTLVVYGRRSRILEVSQRRNGRDAQAAHREARAAQETDQSRQDSRAQER